MLPNFNIASSEEALALDPKQKTISVLYKGVNLRVAIRPKCQTSEMLKDISRRKEGEKKERGKERKKEESKISL